MGQGSRESCSTELRWTLVTIRKPPFCPECTELPNSSTLRGLMWRDSYLPKHPLIHSLNRHFRSLTVCQVLFGLIGDIALSKNSCPQRDYIVVGEGDKKENKEVS